MSNPTPKREFVQEYDAETLRLAKLRRESHGAAAGTKGLCDTTHADPKGIAGELAVARAFGFSMEKAVNQPEGDGGVDFTFQLAGRLVTIDVKTASNPLFLIVEKHKITRVADIVVLCGIDLFGFVTFIGWEYGITLASSPVRSFGYGPNYAIAAEKLRGMGELAQILARRER